MDIRIVLSFAFLAIASFYDLKTREVPNKIWLIFLPFSTIATIAYLLVNPNQIYLTLASIAITVLIAIVIFYLGLYGGADAKALITLAVTHPTQVNTPFVLPIFPLSAFNNSLVLMVLAIPFSLIRNLRWKRKTKRPLFQGLETESLWKKVATLVLCVKTSRLNIKPYHMIAERTEIADGETRKTLKIFQRIDEEMIVKDSILEDVFVIYSLPMLPFLGLGYLFAIIIGDLVFRLTATFLG